MLIITISFSPFLIGNSVRSISLKIQLFDSNENPMSKGECVDSKIVLLGSASVGKTCIICRAVSDEFDKELEIGDTTLNLQIWDTAGQERFRTLAPMYYGNAVIALLVFSVIDNHSLQDVQNWVEEMKQQTEQMPTLFVVANKIDLVDERRVLPEQGQAVATTGDGIEELSIRVAEESLKKLKSDDPGVATIVTKQQTVSLKSEGSTNKKCKC
jgi:small GTP-binding protein